MRICQDHWARVKAALDERGIGDLGGKSPEDAVRNIVTEVEGRGDENDYDPLMSCNHMISTQGLRNCGLGLMAGDLCPICESVRLYEESWISGPADAALEEVKRRGMILDSAREVQEDTATDCRKDTEDGDHGDGGPAGETA